LHEYPFYEIHVGVLFAVTCKRLFESLFFAENLSMECSVNFILRHIFKKLKEEDMRVSSKVFQDVFKKRSDFFGQTGT